MAEPGFQPHPHNPNLVPCLLLSPIVSKWKQMAHPNMNVSSQEQVDLDNQEYGYFLMAYHIERGKRAGDAISLNSSKTFAK